MEFHEKLRIVAGILCLIVSLLRVVQFFYDLGGAIVYSAIFIPWGEVVNIFEGLAIVLFAFIFSVAATGFAVLVYLGLGIMVIAGRRLNVVTIGCNIITAISIILSIRALAIYAAFEEIGILTTILLILYIIIFTICLISYIKIRKEKIKE
ncbi:MAG: hypothetical protein ACFE9X_02765 [Promethearchaeota archaeon]